jgi:hypothetical protein
MEFIRELVNLKSEDPLFSNDAIEYILLYKWNKYAKK